MPITWHKRTEMGTLQEVFSAQVSYLQNSMFCRLIDSLLDLTLPPLRTASQNKWSYLKIQNIHQNHFGVPEFHYGTVNYAEKPQH